MKIIFLDVDGVLNSEVWNQKHKIETENGFLIDEETIKLLSHFIKTSGAKIVLHSGWRFWFDKNFSPIRKESENFKNLLDKNGLSFYDFTPDLTTEEIQKNGKFSLSKPKEILLWLNNHPDISNWVVIDDIVLNDENIQKHQIVPDSKIGLTFTGIEKARKMLE
ncbi:MAG: hypothetical protein IJZ58_07925 [Oscillospiraceae bacterium]|nr:hypothetical protein [Oscillospiraceae bacterium]